MSCEIKKPERREKTGLSDGGHTIIECSNCLCPLVDVWVTMPQAPYEIDLVATCHACGDKSFPRTIKGGFFLGITDYTKLDKINTVENKVEITTIKGDIQWLVKK